MNDSLKYLGLILLCRKPNAEELAELRAALLVVRRYAPLLIAAYVLWILLTTVPAFFRERPIPYYFSAVLFPNVIALCAASLVARVWIGYRTPFASSFGSGFFFGIVFGFGLVTGIVDGQANGAYVKDWFVDTFDTKWWMFALLVVLSLTPELIVPLRRSEKRQLQRIAAAEAQTERQARARAEAELRLLQGQVEPHFLYNALANLRYLIQSKSHDALAMTDALIEYLQTSVPTIRAHHVTLGQEADRVRHYLIIMQMRMQGRLDYSIDVPSALRDVQLPPLMLLTLVENAIKHGIGPKVEGGRVTVSAYDDCARVRVKVTDTGAGLSNGESEDASPAGTGLANTRERLRLVYGNEATLRLYANAPQGAIAELCVPKALPLAETASFADAVEEEPVPAGARRKGLTARVDGARIRVVSSWLVGVELWVNERRVASDKRAWFVLASDQPVLRTTVASADGRAHRIEVKPWPRVGIALRLKLFVNERHVPWADANA